MVVGKIGFTQKSHVNKAHPPEKETHQKHVAGIVGRSRRRQIESLDFFHHSQRQCPFHGFFNTGINSPERASVIDNIILHGTVVCGTEYAHIE